MTKKQKLQAFIYFFAVLILCGGIIAWYANSLSRAVSASTVEALEELTLHDLYNINGTLSHTWNHLEGVGQRLRAAAPKTFLELSDDLYAQKDASTLTGLGVLDKNGFLYTENQEIVSSQDTEYAKKQAKGEKKTVMLYDGKLLPEMAQNALLFTVAITPFQVENAVITAVVGVQDLRFISNQLKIDSFDGKGFSTVIDSKGNFIVNIPGQGGISNTNNFFEWFTKGTFAPGQSAQSLINSIKNGEDSAFTYTNADGVEKVVSFMRVPDTDWALMVNIPTAVLKKQSQGFVSSALAVLCVTLLLLIGLMLFFFHIRLKVNNEQKQTSEKEDFLAHVRHEIRTPLNGIMGLSYLMQKSLDDHQQMQEYVKKLSYTARYLQTIVNDILDLSQLAQNKIALDQAAFSLDDMFVAIDSIMQLHLETRSIRFVKDIQLTHPHIIGDETRLEQVLLNLLNNAINFTPEGGTITLRVRQSVSSNQTVKTHFEIEDTGYGMSETLQRAISQALQTTSLSAKNQANNTAQLGIAICALLVHKMGGTIRMQSQLGKGSLFTVELPAKAAEATAKRTSGGKRGGKDVLKILVAEDNELNAEILIEALSLEGHQVSWAADGKQAVELFQESEPNEFDLVLMDLQMPIMDGYEATRQLRALDRPDAKTVPVWACTANTLNEEHNQAKNSGMNGFIPKPIDVKRLLKKLETDA